MVPGISRLPLKITVPVLLTAPVLAVVAVLWVLGSLQAREIVDDLVAQNLGQVHDRIAGRVDSLLWLPRRMTAINATLITQGRLDPRRLRTWRETAFEEMRSFQGLSSVTWGDEQGDTFWIARYPWQEEYEYAIQDEETGEEIHVFELDADGLPESRPSGRFPFDPRERPWYRAAREAGEATWSDIYAWVHRDGSFSALGIAYARPVRDAAGQLLGVIDSDISLHDLSRFLASLEIGKNGHAFIIEEDGRLIASSGEAPILDDRNEQLPASRSLDRPIAAAGAHLAQHPAPAAAAGSPYRATLSLDGRRFLLMVSPIAEGSGLRWLVATVVPEEDFLAGVHAVRRRGLQLGLLAVGLTVVLGVLLGIRMVRPFLSLAGQVRRIARGELKQEVRIEASPEFTRLSDEINWMTAQLRDRERLESELKIANEIQMAMIPGGGGASEKREGFDLSALLVPAKAVGGDLYDFFSLGDGRLCVIFGDVSDKGVPAALFMARTVTLAKTIARGATSSSELLTDLNRELSRENEACMFVTLICALVNPRLGRIEWANAGHNPPVLLDADRGARYLDPPDGAALGLDEEATYEAAELELAAGETLLLYTDGVTEAVNPSGEMYETARLLRLAEQITRHPVTELTAAVLDSVQTFAGSAPQSDDITILALRLREWNAADSSPGTPPARGGQIGPDSPTEG